MAGESHRERFVTMRVVSAVLFWAVKEKLDIELVEHFMKNDTRAEKTS